MKIKDIITESHQTSMAPVPKHQEPVMGKAFVFRDNGGLDRTHHLYRIMLAAAVADGKGTGPIDGIDGLTWHSKNNTAHPYTQEEYNMMKAAFATIGADWEEPVATPPRELDDVNRKSTTRQVGPIQLQSKSK